MIDSARHYLPIPAIKRIIDSITYSKFNALHWHLSDNEAMVKILEAVLNSDNRANEVGV